MFDLLAALVDAAPVVAQRRLGDDRDQVWRRVSTIEDRLAAQPRLQRALDPLRIPGPDLQLRPDVRLGLEQPGKDPRRLSLWWINRSEWEGLIDVAGLEVEALYGGFERQAFSEESREFVWVARKPA